MNPSFRITRRRFLQTASVAAVLGMNPALRAIDFAGDLVIELGTRRTSRPPARCATR